MQASKIRPLIGGAVAENPPKRDTEEAPAVPPTKPLVSLNNGLEARGLCSVSLSGICLCRTAGGGRRIGQSNQGVMLF